MSPRDIRREMRRDAKQSCEPMRPAVRIEPPKNRSECVDGPRPCPFVSCRYHLFLEVTAFGGMKMPFGQDLDVLGTMKHTCALDIADAGSVTLDEAADLMRLTTERVRQVEAIALEKAKAGLKAQGIDVTHFTLSEEDPTVAFNPASLRRR